MKRLLLTFGIAILCVVAYSQRTITGVVTDDTGEGLIGASVLAEGSSLGTVTDFDGSYTLDVPEGTAALLFSYTGYQEQRVEIGASNVIDLVMQEGVALQEVVVTAMGLEKDARKLAYSVESVKAEEFANSGESDVVNSLNSKAAGVVVTSSSGTPGASANIRIRGATSINRSNSPLFVIDGIPIDNSSSGDAVDGVSNSNRAVDINPNDVESMSVLKGAAATAVYGIRAANGVVLITTKKGASGKPKITVNSRVQFDQVNQLPDLQSEYAQGNHTGYLGPETFAGDSWGPRISELEYDGDTEYPFDKNGKLVPRGTGNGVPAQAYDPYDFFVTGVTYDLNASISGGTDKVRYYFSGGRIQNDGIVPNSTWARNSFRVNSEFQASDRWKFDIAANYVQSGGFRTQRGSNLRGTMLGLLRNTPTFDIGNGKTGQEAADDLSSYELADGTQRSYRWGIYDNPYWVVNRNYTEDNVNRIIGHAGTSYEITPNLSVNYKLGVDNYSDTRLGRIGIVPSSGFNWFDGSVENRDISSTDLNSDLTINYGTQLSDDVRIDLLAGHNYLKQRWTRRITEGNVLGIPDFYNISNATNINASEVFNNRDLVGLFAVADVNIKDYLFLNGTIRNDWSSTLAGTDNPSFLSYSAGFGFAFSELMPDASWLDFGKFRASYGSNGNDADAFATIQTLERSVISGDGFLTDNEFPFSSVNSFEQRNTLSNPNLVPERTTTIEFGLQMDFLRGRVGFDVSYYDSRSTDLIIPVDISAASGGTRYFINAAEISNTGIEALVKVVPVRNKNFKWVSDFNFTTYENDVVSLAEGVENILMAGFTSTSSRAVAGQPYGAIYGEAFQRTASGELLIGANGYPVIDPVTQVVGDPNPDFILGWRNTFTIANDFTVSALLDIREGGDVWCGTCGIIDYFGTSQNSADLRTQNVVFDGVTADGARNTQSVPYYDPTISYNQGYFRRYGFGGISEMSIYDGSWIRLREVSVGYSLPKAKLQTIGFDRASITLSGRNLWLSTDYPGIDPETNLTGASNGIGLDYFNDPNTRSYSISLNLTF